MFDFTALQSVLTAESRNASYTQTYRRYSLDKTVSHKHEHSRGKLGSRGWKTVCYQLERCRETHLTILIEKFDGQTQNFCRRYQIYE